MTTLKTPTPTPGVTLMRVNMATVKPEPIDWLWKGWLARGKLHILGGHAGDGKSTLAAAIAATLSAGGQWPDGSRAPAGTVVILPAEDGLSDTVRPRLDVHGAVVERVEVISYVTEENGRIRPLDLAGDQATLEELAQETDLIVIDPLTGYMPGSDRNAEGAVRDLLTPLAAMAERTGVAILAIMHVGKPSGTVRRPLQQLLGATAFGALARVVWMVAPIPGTGDGPEHKALAVVKSNLAPRPAALEWSRPLDAAIVWHGETTLPIAALLSESGAEPKPQPRDEAKALLLELLADGQRYVGDIRDAAHGQGISRSTLDRAINDLGCLLSKEKDVQHGRWLIELPPVKSLTPMGTEVSDLSNLAGDEPLNAPSGVVGGTAGTHVACHPEAAAEGSPPVGSSPTEGDSSLRLGMTGHRDDGHTTEGGDYRPEGLKALKSLTPTSMDVNALAADEPPDPVKALKSLTPTGTDVSDLADTTAPTSPATDAVASAAGDPPAFTPKTVARYVALVKDPPGYDDRHLLKPLGDPALSQAVAQAILRDPDPWEVEPISSQPILPLSRILTYRDQRVRRQMLRTHPVAARKAAIRWHEESQRYPHPDAWADLLLLEVDDTTRPDIPPADAVVPDQAFCTICDKLLPLPEDRARGYHERCAA